MYPFFYIDGFLLGQEHIFGRIPDCQQAGELVSFGSNKRVTKYD